MEISVADKFVTSDMSYMDDMGYMGEMAEGTQQVSKADELLGSWIFVGGITAGVLALGVLLGLLLAKRRIKKGIDLYED